MKVEATTNSRVGRSFRRVARVVNMGGQQSNAPAILSTEYRNEPFVRHGRHNLFNEFLRALADNCPPLNACIDTMAQFIAGHGIEFVDEKGEEIPAATKKWAELMSQGQAIEEGADYFGNAVGKDVALVGYGSMEVVWDGNGIPAAVHHLDGSRLRSGKKEASGIIQNHYWCSNWEQYAKKSKDFPLITIPSWEAKGFQAKKVIIYKSYHQGTDYLGLPWWLPGITNAEVLSRIPRFNLTQIDTGFRPSFHIHVFTQKDETDLLELDENIEAVFTGADGKSYAVTTGTPEEGAPVFNELSRGDHAGELEKVEDKYEQIIYRAFGIPPILMGIDVNTGMSGKGLAVSETLSLFVNTKVKPLQRALTVPAKRIMDLCGIPTFEARVKQLVAFEPAKDAVLNRNSYLARTTVNQDLINNNLDPLPAGDPRGNLMLCEMLKGAGVGDTTDKTSTEEDA